MPGTIEAGGGDSRGVRLTRAALAIALFTVLTRVLGFGEKLAIAAVFGTDWNTDAWFVLVSVPTLLFLFVRELSEPVLLPALVGHLDGGRRARALGVLRLFLWSVGGLVSLLALAIAIAPQAALGVLAPGFEPAVISRAAGPLRWIAPAAVLLSLSALTYAALNAQRRFALPAAGDALLKLGPLFGCLLLAQSFGIAGLVAGFVVGAGGRLGLHLYGLRRDLPALRSAERVPPEERRQLALLLAPLVVGALFAQLSEVFDNSFSTLVGEGGVAAKTFARKLRDLPIEVVPYALSVALFPTFASLAARGQRERLDRLLGRSVHGLAVLFVPLCLLLVLFAEPVVSTALERGRFDADSRRLVAGPLRMYGLGMVVFAVEALLVNFWFALRDTLTPIVVGLLCVGLNVALCALLVGPLGVAGIALALTISKTVKLIALTGLLTRRGVSIPWAAVLWAAARLCVAAVAGAAALLAFQGAWTLELGSAGTATRALYLSSGAGALALGFGAALLAIGAPERALAREGLSLVRALASRRAGVPS